MNTLRHEGPELARIHKRNNDKKYFCHFTGFLEGIAASGFLERGEVEPLIAECIAFVERVADEDASDIVQDFQVDLLEYDTIAAAAEVRRAAIDQVCPKSSLNRFLGFCRGIVCDDIITQSEALELLAYLEEHPNLLEVVGVRQIYISCIDAIADGILDSNESAEICSAIGHVIGDSYSDTGLPQTFGVANYEEYQIVDIATDLDGATVVLTGKFGTSPRKILERTLAAHGAVLSRSVSGKTDYLVIGGECSRDWIEMNRGTKLRKAQELRASTDRPLLVSEMQLLRYLRPEV